MEMKDSDKHSSRSRPPGREREDCEAIKGCHTERSEVSGVEENELSV